MKKQIEKCLEQRLEELKVEFESGKKFLADLETKETNTRETLLRIQGAIQVLEEVLNTINSAASCESETVEVSETEIIEKQ